MKRIPATKGYEILVDDEDFVRLSQYRWFVHASTSKKRRPYPRPARRCVVEGRVRIISCSHEILPQRDGLVVDHINGDPWDNRRCNLRYCTTAENVRNRKKPRGQWKNPYKGVYLHSGGKFQARITFEGRAHALGVHLTAEDAARAYDEAATRLHGKFARLNFPSEAA